MLTLTDDRLTDCQFGVWEADKPADRQSWLTCWQSWPQHEIHAHPDYVRLTAPGPTSRPCCAYWRSREGNVLYPFLLRDLQPEPCWSASIGPATDTITPYGYGGPFVWEAGNRSLLAVRFWDEMDRWASNHQVVSEFVRFSLFEDNLLEYPGLRTENQMNVVRCLEPHFDEIVRGLPSRVRYDVRRSQREGIVVERDATGARIDDFLRLYRSTMDRRKARSCYYFSPEFFHTIHRDLAGHFIYFHALHRGQVVSSDLILVSAESIYLYLSATDSTAYGLRPNHPLKLETIRWAQELGKRHFVLGGGYEPDDGIFRYKRSFAPGGLTPFHVGQRILRPHDYRQLAANRRGAAPGPGNRSYFPAYRAA